MHFRMSWKPGFWRKTTENNEKIYSFPSLKEESPTIRPLTMVQNKRIAAQSKKRQKHAGNSSQKEGPLSSSRQTGVQQSRPPLHSLLCCSGGLPPSSCLTNSIPQRRKLNNMCTGQHTHRLGHYCTYIRVAEVKGYQEEEGKQKK